MQVEVRLFAGLQKYVPDAKSGEPFLVTLAEKSTLGALLQQLGIPEKEAFVTMVNGAAVDVSGELKADDRVGLFPPVGGG